MKQTPKLDRIQRLMQPGVISKEGFLGNDTRKLADIIEDDQRLVASLGLTHEMIADVMEEITDAGRETFGSPKMVGKFLKVTVEGSMGKIASPFGGLYNKENITVLNIETNESITWTTLNIHMIRDHGFYQGKGSCYRIEPKNIAKIFKLKQVI